MSSTEDGRYADGGGQQERRDEGGQGGGRPGEAGRARTDRTDGTDHTDGAGRAGPGDRSDHEQRAGRSARTAGRKGRGSGGAGRQRPTGGPAPGRPPGRAAYRRALRREAPTVVGMLLDGHDFAAMTGYPSFAFDDHERYLHHLDELLRELHDRGTHVAVALFDPDAYADYCESTRQPPDAPRSRARYVAESATAGPAVRYERQPMPRLRAELAREAERRATWERASDLLIAAGTCADCGEDLAHCTFDRASHTLLRLIEVLGPGRHHVVCSLSPDDAGPTLLAALVVQAPPQPPPSPSFQDGGGGEGGREVPEGGQEDGDLRFSEADALVLCTVMAASAVTARPAGLVVRTTVRTADGTATETVRGWTLRGGEPRPLTEAEVFSAYCTDPVTGDPVPPEPGVRYRPGLPLPPPLPGDTR